MARRICKNEFSVKNFGFECSNKECNSFYISQWSTNRASFLGYRTLMASFSLGWTVGIYAWCSSYCPQDIANGYRYITLWSDVIRTFYFVVAVILALVGFINERKGLDDQGFVKWLRGVTWFSHVLAMESNTIVTILFWPLVAATLDPSVAFSPISIYLHSVNLPILLVDLLIAAFPIRLLHAIYGTILAIFYGIFTVILWQVGDTNAVYEILDWEKGPGFASALIIGSGVVAAPLIQIATFGIHLLRRYCFKIYMKLVNSDNNSRHPETVELNNDHPETHHDSY